MIRHFLLRFIALRISFDVGSTVGSDVSHLVNLVELNLAENFITTLCSDDFMLMQQLKV